MENMQPVVKANGKRFKIDSDVVAFIFSNHTWGIQRKANLKVLLQNRGAADKAETKLKLSKQLIVSPEFDAIGRYMTEVKSWIISRSVPSFFREGTYLFRLSMVTNVEEYLQMSRAMLDGLIDSFIAVYPAQVQEARALLEPDGQFNERDYPSVEALRRCFYWESMWISFDVPEGLPVGVRNQELEKMRNMWNDAAENITSALRESFAKLVSHAVDKLTPGPDGKPKVFRDTLLTNITDFLDTFRDRNITNDTELARLTEQATKVLTGIDKAQLLRDNEAVKQAVVAGFAEIQSALDPLVITKAGRRFNLDD